MRVLLLSDINSIHTKRWVHALKGRGVDTGLFSLTKLSGSSDHYDGAAVFSHGIPDKYLEGLNLAGKLRYFTALPFLKKCIKSFRPDIVHAHYVSSYGTLGALSGFHPFLISVWGSDVYIFPQGSKIREMLIRRNLLKADRILSTSRAMAEETKKYTGKNIEITPFGIDLYQFRPGREETGFPSNCIVIGTTKALETVYGIQYLIEAFATIRRTSPGLCLKLMICSGGTREKLLKERIRSLGIEADVVFKGKITHDQVPSLLNMMDIFVAPSLRESFGVSVIEASACGLPVVASDTGGLKEVVEDGVTGLLVPPGDPEKLAEVLFRLIDNPLLRKEFGKNGRERVKKLYDWQENVSGMLAVYESVMQGKEGSNL